MALAAVLPCARTAWKFHLVPVEATFAGLPQRTGSEHVFLIDCRIGFSALFRGKQQGLVFLYDT